MDDTKDRRHNPAGPRPGRGGRGATPPEPAATQHLDLDALNAYLDRGLTSDDSRLAAAHLATCADCRRELVELRATVSLLRGLPQYTPRRSFRLGPEHARIPTGITGWLGRLLPPLPALRVATAIVALLLVAVTLGDVVSHRGDDGNDDEGAPSAALRPAQESGDDGAATGDGTNPVAATSISTGDPGLDRAPQPTAIAAAREAAPAEVQAAAPAAAASESFAEESVPTPPDLAAEPAAPARSATDADQTAGALAAVPTVTPVGVVASPPPPIGRMDDAAAGNGAASPVGPNDPAAGGVASDETAAEERSRPSNWRLAEVGLGLLLLWFLVGLAGLQRLGARAGAAEGSRG